LLTEHTPAIAFSAEHSVSGIAYLTPLVSLLLLTVFRLSSVSWVTVLGALLIVFGAYRASQPS
jgi:drug/metabolite transporter (DMT)-like permease